MKVDNIKKVEVEIEATVIKGRWVSVVHEYLSDELLNLQEEVDNLKLNDGEYKITLIIEKQ